MQYLVLLYADESTMPRPGSLDFEGDLAGFAAFGELAAGAIVAGEALEQRSTARTVRHQQGMPLVTDGPFAETTETLAGLYVLEAQSLDDAVGLAGHIPVAAYGAVEVRPMVQWFDRASIMPPAPPGTDRYLATIHGPETDVEVPGTVGWDDGVAAHERFAAAAADTIVAGGAVHPAATAVTVRVRDGELRVTTGPFSEAIEIVGGFYVLRGSADVVAEMAGHIPVVAGGAIELRPVMDLDG